MTPFGVRYMPGETFLAGIHWSSLINWYGTSVLIGSGNGFGAKPFPEPTATY